jgi:tRNA A-37 threonylcarbamoyl transferase component Bud32
MTATHPSDRELDDFLLGKSLDPDHAAIEDHLAGCPGCQDRAADRTAGDTLTELLAAARTQADADRATAPTPALTGSATPSQVAATQGWDGGAPVPAGDDVPPALAGHAKYHVRRRLGTGGMGTVWLAEHAVMNRLVAVKVIRPDLLARPGATTRFLREVRAAAKLHHPHIVTAFDAEPVGDSCLLVMEYVPGETLGDRVKAGPLPVAEACRAVRDAARGLAAAHSAGLVHRDVKPHNLIRDADGRTKVLDFGLAAVAAGEVVAAGGDGLSGTGLIAGTPDYIAPEQAAGPHTADARSDVYGLGCTLYHLLAGRPPFPEGSVVEKLDAQRTREPDPITGLPVGLAAVLAKMTAKRPAERYQTAAEVAAALEPFTRAAGPVRRRMRRRLLAAAGLLAAALLAAAAVVFKIQFDNQELTIHTDDADVEVVVKRKGEVVRVLDRKNGQTWEIDTAANQIGLADQSDGLNLALPDGKAVVLRRAGKETFRVTRVLRAATDRAGLVTLEPRHRIAWPEGGGFNDCDVSPDGRFVLAVSSVRTKVVRVWEAETGRLFREWRDAVGAGFTADGRQVLVANNKFDSTLRVYNLATGELDREFAFGEWTWAFKRSADGTRLLRTNNERSEVWDFPSGKMIRDFPYSVDNNDLVKLTPDGRHLLLQGQGKPPLRVYDVATGQPSDGYPRLRDAPPLTPWWHTLGNFSEDGQRVLAVDGHTLKVLDTATGRPIAAIDGILENWGLLSPDGRRVFGSSAERNACGVWDATTGRRLATLKLPEVVDSSNFSRTSRDGRTTVFALPSGNVYVFRLPEPPARKP